MCRFRQARQALVLVTVLLATFWISKSVQSWTLTRAVYPATVLTFSPDGQWLASSSYIRRSRQKGATKTTIEIWRVPELRIVKQLPEGQRVIALAFSPDGKILAAGGMNNWVSLWKLPEGKRVRRFMMKAKRYDEVHSIAFSPDGRLLAAGTLDGVIYFWQMPQAKLVGVLNARRGEAFVSLAFSPDGKKLAALSRFHLQLWDVRTKKLLWEREHVAWLSSIAFTKDGSRLIGVGYAFLMLSTTDGSVISKQGLPSFHSPPGGVSADGQFIALYDYSGSVKVKTSHDFKDIWQASIISWKLKKQLHRWAERVERGTNLPMTKSFSRPILPSASMAAFSPDNRWLALGFDNGQIKLWRIR